MQLQKELLRCLRGDLPPTVRETLGNITFHQADALRLLHQRGALTMTELAEAMSASLSSMTQLADRMVHLGLAVRLSDPDDRRIVRLDLSDSARSGVEELTTVQQQALLEAFEVLTDHELSTLMTLLQTLAQSPAVLRQAS